MAEFTRVDTVQLDREEIGFLISLMGVHSPQTITRLGLDLDVFEDLYEAFTACAYSPLYDEGPRTSRVKLADAVTPEEAPDA